MPDEISFPSKQSHEVAYQIGVLCIVWSGLEHLINALLAHYLKLDDSRKAEIFMGSIDLKRKLAILKPLALLQETTNDFLMIEAFIDFVDVSMRPQRNRFVHDLYYFTPDTSNLTTYKTQIGKPTPIERVLKSSVKRDIDAGEIAELITDLEICSMYAAGQILINNTRDNKNEEFKEIVKRNFLESYSALQNIIEKYRIRARNKSVELSSRPE